MGESLQEVEVQYSGSGTNRVTTRWFKSKKQKPVDADVLLWTDHRDNIIKQQVSICGSVVEWNILDGLRTGMTVEQEIKGEKDASESVQFDQNSNIMNIQMAVRMLDKIPSMDHETKEIVLRNFKSPSSFSSLSAQEILYKYGKTPKGVKLNFWQRFKVQIRKWLS
jgi:hypothetical protein